MHQCIFARSPYTIKASTFQVDGLMDPTTPDIWHLLCSVGPKKHKNSSNVRPNTCLIAVYRVEKSSAYKLNENLCHDIMSQINPAAIRQNLN
jgi:hypothetical protein